eukprot:3230205-Alexandrium_andersonii.AAC.1
MEAAAAPNSPARRSVLVPRSKSAEVGDPEASALRAKGAALRPAPLAPRAVTEGVADFRRLRARDKDVSP